MEQGALLQAQDPQGIGQGNFRCGKAGKRLPITLQDARWK
jgi:hypothetical protein